tara:strand:+ start:35 stop:247 length:213 start_codon:yes stop_codon:yes gene_type:complete
MKQVKFIILLKSFSVTINTWNSITRRFSDSTIDRSGRCVQFEGTENSFNQLMDRLYADESNFKIIGVYNS